MEPHCASLESLLVVLHRHNTQKVSPLSCGRRRIDQRKKKERIVICRFLTSFRMSQFLSVEELRADYRYMKEHLRSLNLEMVICHNDCWRENILYDKDTGESSGFCDNS